ncbi:MAG TPA: M28 family peptidase [Longimicrobiales bacterium]|nr:M28 family peptidase [Longimicrobiales bacterium]
MRAVVLGCAAAVVTGACADSGSGAQRTGGIVVDTSRIPRFDGDAAFDLLRRQVAFGPRVSGTPGHAAQLQWMEAWLESRADTVALQPFTHRARNGNVLTMANVFAQFRPDHPDRILLIAHWDTRPTADMDQDRADEPIDGANDGASGVAVLLHLADVLARNPPPMGVDILLTDGEDYGPGEADMYLGAKHFAANRPPGYRPLYGVLLDMVADREPMFPVEGNSSQLAPEVVERVWGVAEQLGLGAYFPRRVGMYVTDDHIPLNNAGIRTINIIDFDYGPANSYWHTHQDIVENTAPLGLELVGRVVAAVVYSGG